MESGFGNVPASVIRLGQAPVGGGIRAEERFLEPTGRLCSCEP